MSTARGDYAALVSRLQSTFGTAESAGNGDFYKLPFYELTSSPTEEMENDESLYGDAFPAMPWRACATCRAAWSFRWG